MRKTILRKLDPFFAGIALLGAGFIASGEILSAHAHEGARPGARSQTEAGDFEQTLIDSDFVFQGEVIRKEFALSLPVVDDHRSGGVPHTFVTYRIERLIKGKPSPSEVTLRFLGGDVPGVRRTRISQMPMIAEGDRDIVFVRGNGRKACPMIRWGEGRIRLSHGTAFGEHSEQIGFDPTNRIRIGAARPALDGPRTDGLYTRVDSRFLHPSPQNRDAPHPAGFRPASQAAELTHALLRAQAALEKEFPGRPVVSQDPKKPFTFTMPRSVPPQAPPLQTLPPK
jgi:hypothetical protein